MPTTEKTLGKDFELALNDKILYDKVDTEITNNVVDGMLTLKLDFLSKEDFLRFVGDRWAGSGREYVWIGNQIFSRDKKLLTDKPIKLQYVSYKDSIFDAAPAVLVLAKYTQDLENK